MLGERARRRDAQQAPPVRGLGHLDRGLLLQAEDLDGAAGQAQPAWRERQSRGGAGEQRVVQFLAQLRYMHGDAGVGHAEFRCRRMDRTQADHS